MIRNIIIVFFLFCCPLFVLAHTKSDISIIVSEHGDLHYSKQSDGSYYFSGQQKLVGLLIARWGKDLSGETGSKMLYLQFLPEKKQISLLPVINDVYKESNRMINLNYLNKNANIEIVNKYFKHVPITFFQNKEGIIKQQVLVIIDKYSASVDCDYRYYYGEIVSIIPVNSISETIEPQKECSNYIFEDWYLIKSKDGYSNLHKNSNNQSTIIKKLLNGTEVIKLKTVNNWFYISVNDGNKNKPIQGFIHKNEVILLD